MSEVNKNYFTQWQGNLKVYFNGVRYEKKYFHARYKKSCGGTSGSKQKIKIQ